MLLRVLFATWPARASPISSALFAPQSARSSPISGGVVGGSPVGTGRCVSWRAILVAARRWTGWSYAQDGSQPAHSRSPEERC